jgi:exodeoxyribonuclease V beta subunit
LNASGIPAVLHSSGNIFESPEAAEMEALLACIAHPNDIRRLRAALATQIWGMTASELATLDNDSENWQAVMQRVGTYHLVWQTDGFMPMFRQFLDREGAAVRLAGLADGERRLTNLLHLSEVLHRHASEMNLNRLALVNWLAEQRLQGTRRAEIHQLRMESDAKAVKIVTIHKSKGLEYPVVFCPFNWEDSRVRGGELQYHDPREGYRPTLNLEVQPDDDCRRWAQNEQLAENLRLLYVALTRARNRCYLAWGRIRSADTSALAYLLHARLEVNEKIENADLVGQLSAYMSGRTDENLLADLDDLAGNHPDCLAIRLLPRQAPSAVVPPRSRLKLRRRKFTGAINRTRSIISYSSLIARRTAGVDLPDHDDPVGHWQSLPPGNLPEMRPAARANGSDVFSFVKGTQTGIFFHELFERMTFALNDRESRAALVQEKLEQYGFEPWWQPGVTELLQQVIELELPDIGRGFHLGQLEPEQRLHEMEFYVALRQLTPDRLVKLLAPHFSRAEKMAEFDRIKTLAFSPARGFLKGFIDMVFSFGGKYFLVDWKSNHLGSTKEDYAFENLKASMDEHFYGLQSLFYTMALDRYLRAGVPDYRYETHFGGAYYVFIRGVRVEWGDAYGVFKQRWPAQTIRSVAEALTPQRADALDTAGSAL